MDSTTCNPNSHHHHINTNQAIRSLNHFISHTPPPLPSPNLDGGSMAHMYLSHLHPDFARQYTLCDELGSGGFGFVCTAKRQSDGLNVAVKFIHKNKVSSFAHDHDLGIVPFEVYIVKNLTHKNIIDYVGFFQDAQFFYLIMELHGMSWQSSNLLNHFAMPRLPNSHTKQITEKKPSAALEEENHPLSQDQKPVSPDMKGIVPAVAQRSITSIPYADTCSLTAHSGLPILGRRHSMDLFECIETQSKLSESIVRYIFLQVAEAIETLLRFNVVHRDIKDENIVVDQHYKVKLIDFGSASFLQKEGKYFDRFAGTVKYCPPEILKGEKYRGPEQEIWSLGVLLYTMLFSEPPFMDPVTTVSGQIHIPPRSKRTAAYASYPPISKPLMWKLFGYSDSVVDLLLQLLARNVHDRPTIHAVLKHPWVSGAVKFVHTGSHLQHHPTSSHR